MSLLTLRSATQSFRVSFQIRVSCSRTVHHRKFNKVQFSLKNKNKNSFSYRLVETGSWPMPCVEVHLTVSIGHILNLTLKHQLLLHQRSDVSHPSCHPWYSDIRPPRTTAFAGLDTHCSQIYSISFGWWQWAREKILFIFFPYWLKMHHEICRI